MDEDLFVFRLQGLHSLLLSFSELRTEAGLGICEPYTGFECCAPTVKQVLALTQKQSFYSVGAL